MHSPEPSSERVPAGQVSQTPVGGVVPIHPCGQASTVEHPAEFGVFGSLTQFIRLVPTRASDLEVAPSY